MILRRSRSRLSGNPTDVEEGGIVVGRGDSGRRSASSKARQSRAKASERDAGRDPEEGARGGGRRSGSDRVREETKS